MAGTLTIHSTGDGSLLSGHSWIEYRKEDESESVTYGTWGNSPREMENGLYENLEQGMQGYASRTVQLDDKEEECLFETIRQYKDKATDAWSYISQCSGFAVDAWKNATGEVLCHLKYGIGNPSMLAASIKVANEKDSKDAVNTPARQLSGIDFRTSTRKRGSRRRVKDTTQR